MWYKTFYGSLVLKIYTRCFSPRNFLLLDPFVEHYVLGAKSSFLFQGINLLGNF